MKKFLFLAIAATAFASCSQDEVLEVAQKEAISFDNAFVGNVTRAAIGQANDPSYSTSNPLTSFKVWGTATHNNATAQVFTDQLVEGTVGNDSEWNTTENTQYWIAGAFYNFAALVNANVTEADLQNGLPTQVTFTSNGTTDLLYAKSEENIEGKETGNDKVQMDFNHLLSKVKFTLVNKSMSINDYSFKLHSVVVKAPTQGTCTLATKEWGSYNNTTSNVSFSDIGISTGTEKLESDSEILLIPSDVTVSFKVDYIYKGTTLRTKEFNPTATHTLIAGNAYNFVIEVGVDAPIQFTVVKYPEWITVDDITVEPVAAN